MFFVTQFFVRSTSNRTANHPIPLPFQANDRFADRGWACAICSSKRSTAASSAISSATGHGLGSRAAGSLGVFATLALGRGEDCFGLFLCLGLRDPKCFVLNNSDGFAVESSSVIRTNVPKVQWLKKRGRVSFSRPEPAVHRRSKENRPAPFPLAQQLQPSGPNSQCNRCIAKFPPWRAYLP